MTPAEITANRAAAVATVRAQMALPANPTDWTYEQRVAYNKALAAYILANPALFDASEVGTANTVSQKSYSSLEDASFDWGEFAELTAAPAVNALKGIGSGALSVANAAKWAIPALALVAVLVLAEKYSGGTAISSVKKVFKK